MAKPYAQRPAQPLSVSLFSVLSLRSSRSPDAQPLSLLIYPSNRIHRACLRLSVKDEPHRRPTKGEPGFHLANKLTKKTLTISGSSVEEIPEKPAVRPRVGIIMGCDSDYLVMKTAKEILQQFNVPYEMKIVSALRTPDLMYSYALSASERGLEIIIVSDAGVAYLPGEVAGLTPLPVIGVPIRCPDLVGYDWLMSILQMHRCVPVANVAIEDSANAGLLAVRMLGISDFDLHARMDQYLKDTRNDDSSARGETIN